MVDTPFTTFPFLATGGTTTRTGPARWSDVVNVKDYGAVGDGVTDDRAAIQAAFDAAYGSAASPHGNSGKYTNRPVWIPRGNYAIGGPLYLSKVQGGHIFGDGAGSTRLFYTGAYSGNAFVANGITPLIITDGWAYSRFEDINLSMADNNSACFYLYWNGSGGAGPTGNVFQGVLVDTATAGFLIGYQTPGLCSETVFINCNAVLCTYGWRNISANALNNICYNCSAASCTVGWSLPTGSMHLYSGGSAANGTDITTGQEPFFISGFRTESANFIDMTASTTQAVISACEQAAGAGAGSFINIGSGKAIIDGCTQGSTTATDGLILGAVGSKVYLRGNDFRNASFLGSFLGTVAQNI